MEGFYGKGLFAREDFARLAGLLAGVQGRFLLSLNDVPGVRETFRAFHQEQVQTKYSVSREGTSKARELLIRNY